MPATKPTIDRPGISTAQQVLATTLRAICDKHRLTQRALADASGYSEKHLSQMLTGANRGTLRSWETVLTAAVLLTDGDSIVDVALPTSDLRAAVAGTR